MPACLLACLKIVAVLNFTCQSPNSFSLRDGNINPLLLSEKTYHSTFSMSRMVPRYPSINFKLKMTPYPHPQKAMP